MAKILPGAIASKISGTIAGTTYSNWRGILVARSKPTPTNVNTPRQTVIRSLMTLLSRAWRDELNQGLRTAWNQRAKNYPWTDVFGQSVLMTGENLYIKQNLVLLDHSLSRQDTPVPEVMPPELIYLSQNEVGASLAITGLELPDALVAAQAPFLDVWVAGGFLSFQYNPPAELVIHTQGLPSGRTHHNSDFRHCFYMPNNSVTVGAANLIDINPPPLQVKNLVAIVRGYNKYGNFTAPRVFSLISSFA